MKANMKDIYEQNKGRIAEANGRRGIVCGYMLYSNDDDGMLIMAITDGKSGFDYPKSSPAFKYNILTNRYSPLGYAHIGIEHII